MVLLKLLSLPYALPAAGMGFIFNKIAELADQELNDDSVVKEQLLLLQVQLEEGEIDEDEYVEQEAVLMQRLREIKARREAMAQEDAAGRHADLEEELSGRRRVIVETPFDDA